VTAPVAPPPVAPVSWGELWDKITILRIKVSRLRREAARANAKRELRLLECIAGMPAADLLPLLAALLAVNTRLWCIEDLIREKEAVQDFGADFVRLARAVYQENDERGRIKADLNRRLNSLVVEEKQYSPYGSAP
jgi:Family of unknown function (DUF6165)